MTHDPSSSGGSSGGSFEGSFGDPPVGIFQARAHKPCSELALVLHALGIASNIVQGPGVFTLTVAGHDASRALEELQQYTVENRDWPPPRDAPPMLSNGIAGAAVYTVALVALFPIGGSGLLGLNWWDAGKLDAGLVMAGEWWRAVTALTLHGGLSHLAGNLVFGVLFAVLAAHSLGVGLTWLGTLLAGTFGNVLNAWIQNDSHTSIGASTAVFGMLGMLVVYEWIRREGLSQSPMRRMAPIFAGAVLLGFLGVGRPESNTDVWAHMTGFASGAVLGFVLGKARLPDRISHRTQIALAAVAGALPVVAWWVALAH